MVYGLNLDATPPNAPTEETDSGNDELGILDGGNGLTLRSVNNKRWLLKVNEAENLTITKL